MQLDTEKYASYSLIREDKKRPNGAIAYKWRAQYPYKDDSGRWKNKRVTLKTEGRDKGRSNRIRKAAELEAEQLRQQMNAEQEAATIEASKPKPTVITVAACVEAYIDTWCKVQRSTETSYRGMLKNGIAPRIGSIPLVDLRKAACDRWVTEMLEEYSRPYVSNSLRLLKAALDWACDPEEHDGEPWTERNPASRVRLPKPDKSDFKRPNALTEDEATVLMSVVNSALSTPNAYGELTFMLAVKISLYAGLRRAEICALRWRDVDLKGCTIHVEQSIGHTNSEFYVKDPKSESSRRAVPMHPELMEDLKRRRAAMIEQCFELGVPLTPEHYVLGGADGSFLKPPRINDHWRALSKNLHLMGTQNTPVAFHGLRHTYATRLINEGTPISQIAALMGHSNPTVTINRYTSPSERGMREAAERLGESLQADIKKRGGRGQVIDLGKTGTDD